MSERARSRMINSGGDVVVCSMALEPLAAVETRWPRLSNECESISNTLGSSSTNRILALISLLSPR